MTAPNCYAAAHLRTVTAVHVKLMDILLTYKPTSFSKYTTIIPPAVIPLFTTRVATGIIFYLISNPLSTRLTSRCVTLQGLLLGRWAIPMGQLPFVCLASEKTFCFAG